MYSLYANFVSPPDIINLSNDINICILVHHIIICLVSEAENTAQNKVIVLAEGSL